MVPLSSASSDVVDCDETSGNFGSQVSESPRHSHNLVGWLGKHIVGKVRQVEYLWLEFYAPIIYAHWAGYKLEC
jgi:hypothetical protein